MNMDLSEIAEIDDIFDLLENVEHSLSTLFQNIDDYDRQQAAIVAATNAGIVKGIMLRLTQLKG